MTTFSISDFKLFLDSQGFFYSKHQIYNLLISLKSKPFVIISGISGTGKTKIIELLAVYLQQKFGYENNIELVPVKPNWNTSKDIMGYHNVIDDIYSITPTLQLFLRAQSNPDKPYFLLLDEMNLARVEHYFSDFLSLIESRRLTNKFEKSKQIVFSEEFYEELLKKFKTPPTLSQIIILVALQKPSNNFETVEYYRDSPLVSWWQKTFSKGDNLLEQFRTELNQKRSNSEPNGIYKGDGSRLAGKAFLAKKEGNAYRLKTEEEMDSDLNQKITELTNFFNSAVKVIEKKKEIKQKPLNLHTSSAVLQTYTNQKNYLDSSLSNRDILYEEPNEYYVPSRTEIPLNVFVIGTVNTDETTYSFSSKVLDRSNVIEFNKIDLLGAYGYGENKKLENEIQFPNEDNINLEIILPTARDPQEVIRLYPEIFNVLVEIFDILNANNLHFGYRVFNEISRYIINFCGENSEKSSLVLALDFQVVQKVLPKLNGSKDELEIPLLKIKQICQHNSLTKTETKIDEMFENLNLFGFTSFIK